MEYGVRHGSVLGLLFFLLYVSDMVRVGGDLGFVLLPDDKNLLVEGSHPALYIQMSKSL
jgi:hypothetical protein